MEAFLSIRMSTIKINQQTPYLAILGQKRLIPKIKITPHFLSQKDKR